MKGHVPLALCVLRKGEPIFVPPTVGATRDGGALRAHHLNFLPRHKHNRGTSFRRNCATCQTEHWPRGCFSESCVCSTVAQNPIWQNSPRRPVRPRQRQAVQGTSPRMLRAPSSNICLHSVASTELFKGFSGMKDIPKKHLIVPFCNDKGDLHSHSLCRNEDFAETPIN